MAAQAGASDGTFVSVIADRLARLAGAVPDRHLELLMRTPARRVVVETIFQLMPRFVDRTAVAGVDMTVRWQIADGRRTPDVYDLVIAQRRCRMNRGAEGDRTPLVTITVEPAELLRLALGRANPVQAYLGGRLKLRGDLMQAAKLTSLFKIPAGAPR